MKPCLLDRIRLAYRVANYYADWPLTKDEVVAFLGVLLSPVWVPVVLILEWVVFPIRRIIAFQDKSRFDAEKSGLDYYQGVSRGSCKERGGQ